MKLKDIIINMKTQATDQEKISANHIPDKGLVFRIFKEHLRVNYKQDKTQITQF